MQQELIGVINNFWEKKLFLSAEILEKGLDFEKIVNLEIPQNLLILNEDNLLLLKENKKPDWLFFDQLRVNFELGEKEQYTHFLSSFNDQAELFSEATVKIKQSYKKKTKKYDVQDFVQYFINRYKAMEKILRNRQELQEVVSIGRLLKKKEKEKSAIIGLVSEKSVTKNGNIMLKMEDPTGVVNVLISKSKSELLNQAKDIVMDEVLGVVGTNGDKIIFANSLFWPDVPFHELKKGPEEAYALVLSDLHVGSNNFLAEDLNRFIKWVRGEIGNEKQREIAQKVKYIFICGDLIDGIGIYPSQEKELEIKDVYQQYDECARFLKQIPSRIKIIICPGNHDALRLSEPQPELDRELAASLYTLPNLIFVSNPSMVTIEEKENFSGFDVLLYHGYSFDYYYTEIENLRMNAAMHKPNLIVKFLLKKRHLAPTHTSSLYAPDFEEDPLVIDKLPDFIMTGHIHKPAVANYKNITIVCGSCWQARTNFQEKVGHEPETSKVPIINLKTREIKLLNFKPHENE